MSEGCPNYSTDPDDDSDAWDLAVPASILLAPFFNASAPDVIEVSNYDFDEEASGTFEVSDFGFDGEVPETFLHDGFNWFLQEIPKIELPAIGTFDELGSCVKGSYLIVIGPFDELGFCV